MKLCEVCNGPVPDEFIGEMEYTISGHRREPNKFQACVLCRHYAPMPLTVDDAFTWKATVEERIELRKVIRQAWCNLLTATDRGMI